ncbi:MAG: substrate-binding domain-containing protein, partial [Caldilinea sp.]|nr:substrate-binding domain-containing protein [Caldilinea sp.]
RIATGAAYALREVQVRVPDEVALVCVDDFGIGSELHPFMTVVRQPESEMGQQVTQLLIDRILGTYTGPPLEVVLPARMVVRQSCGSKRSEIEQAQSQSQGNFPEHFWDDD